MRRAVKLIVYSVVSVLAASAVMIGVRAVLARSSPDPKQGVTRVASAGPTIERVRELSALTTLRVDVADAFVAELRGRTGGATAVLVVRGQVAIGVADGVRVAVHDEIVPRPPGRRVAVRVHEEPEA